MDLSTFIIGVFDVTEDWLQRARRSHQKAWSRSQAIGLRSRLPWR